jgi:chloramphenicol 3-O phosphotransferase
VSGAEGARREQERGDRYAGCNRGSARATHADAEYDFELDTRLALARQLHRRYQACRKPTAFHRLQNALSV